MNRLITISTLFVCCLHFKNALISRFIYFWYSVVFGNFFNNFKILSYRHVSLSQCRYLQTHIPLFSPLTPKIMGNYIIKQKWKLNRPQEICQDLSMNSFNEPKSALQLQAMYVRSCLRDQILFVECVRPIPFYDFASFVILSLFTASSPNADRIFSTCVGRITR